MSFSENNFIQWLSTQKMIGSIDDDMALTQLDDKTYIAYGVDQVIEGCHFSPKTPPHLAGRKLLARNISDVASIGLIPNKVLVALNVANKSENWVKEFYQGIIALAEEFHIEIIGGDTASYGTTFSASITIIGSGKKTISRKNANLKDTIFVTGKLGNSFDSQHHLTFSPRVKEGLFLTDYATAMIDISDGLTKDLSHICQASKLSAKINKKSLPLRSGATINQALNQGEDYELLFTTSTPEKLLKNWHFTTKLTKIGEIISPTKFLLIDSENKPISIKGFEQSN